MSVQNRYGYDFDDTFCDVRKARKPYDCEGAAECGTTILVGDVYLAERVEMFEKERKVCLPCGLYEGKISRGGQLDEEFFDDLPMGRL